jgi:hypothetical protein
VQALAWDIDMKTILQWMHDIEDEEVRIKALASYNEPYVYSHGVVEAETLSTALGKAFFWGESKDGWGYWFSVYDSIYRKENGL